MNKFYTEQTITKPAWQIKSNAVLNGAVVRVKSKKCFDEHKNFTNHGNIGASSIELYFEVFYVKNWVV